MLVLRLSMPCQLCLYSFVLSGAKAATVSTEDDAAVAVVSKQLFVLLILFFPFSKDAMNPRWIHCWYPFHRWNWLSMVSSKDTLVVCNGTFIVVDCSVVSLLRVVPGMF